MGAGAIGLQVQILLLELVFHVATGTVKVFIALLSAEALRRLAGLVLKTIHWEDHLPEWQLRLRLQLWR